MSMRTIHLGDSGTIFKVTIKDENDEVFPFDNTTSIAFYFEKPNGTKFQTVGAPFTDGSDGIVVYTIDTDLIDMKGIWSLQVSIHQGSNSVTLYTDIYDFRVERKLI